MYFRKLLYITGIVCLLSICVWSHTTHAYPSGTAWDTAERDRDTAYEDLDGLETELLDVRAAAEALSKNWEANREKVRAGTRATVSNAAAAALGLVTTKLTGGTGAVVYLPSIFTGFLAAKGGIQVGNTIVDGKAYAKALTTALDALDVVLAKIETAYETYTNDYDVYFTIMVEHDGGLVRFVGGHVSDVYTKEQVYAAVNPRRADGRHDEKNAQTKDWYHSWQRPYQKKPPASPQSVDVHRPKKHWDFKDIVRSFTCAGDCGRKFADPFAQKLASPVRCTQTKAFTNPVTNEIKYFQCTFYMNYLCETHIHQYSPDFGYSDDKVTSDPDETASTTPSTPGLHLQAGAATIEIDEVDILSTMPGEQVTLDLVMPSDKGYSQIYLYLADSTDTDYGDQLGDTIRPSSSSVETAVTLEFTIPSGVSGVCTFTAYIYPHPSASVQECYEYKFKIYVSYPP